MKKYLIILVCLVGFIFAQTHNTIRRIYQFPDTTGWYWRMWHVNNSGQIISQHTVDKDTYLTTEGWGAGPPPFALWAYELANWPPPQWQPGNRLISQADFDSAYGTRNHKGFYAINNDTLRGDQNPQFLINDTLRAMPHPRPSVWDSLHNDTVFVSLDTFRIYWDKPGQTPGNPLVDNIIGYAVYQDTTGTGEDDTLAGGLYQYFNFRRIVTDTSFLDTLTGLKGHLMYYAIRFVYRPDTTPKLMSKFLSRNSVGVFHTGLIGIKESSSECQSPTATLEVYPNPFRNRLDIRYTIQDTGSENIGQGFLQEPMVLSEPEVSLAIYDVTGRLVKDLSRLTVNGERSTVHWDGNDNSGKPLPTGVYFVELKTGRILTMKVILQR
ncbi:MAG: T9SS type A sorting domain-containing protein [candidate division WOR-3 bacterium]